VPPTHKLDEAVEDEEEATRRAPGSKSHGAGRQPLPQTPKVETAATCSTVRLGKAFCLAHTGRSEDYKTASARMFLASDSRSHCQRMRRHSPTSQRQIAWSPVSRGTDLPVERAVVVRS